ncbi:uncharacterized protein [Procambarus clarkii]|uniref:uncharacterized protein n=1 Tax=Procambarus clarkii TaxID=6728 RepID=UPI003743EC84
MTSAHEDNHRTRLRRTPAVTTPVDADALDALLVGYPLRDYVVGGFRGGFLLGFEGVRTPLTSRNPQATTDLPHIVGPMLDKELSLGRIAGPFEAPPPFKNFKCLPIALREKSTPGKYRLLHNLSYPYSPDSVNANIPRESTSVTYQSIHDAVTMVVSRSPGAHLAKCDIAEAFRIVPVHPSDYHLLGFSYGGKYYYEKMLSMGAAPSCRIFETFSSALQWILA